MFSLTKRLLLSITLLFIAIVIGETWAIYAWLIITFTVECVLELRPGTKTTDPHHPANKSLPG